MPVILLGGIYGGITTPTEAAAVAAAYALIISLVLYRDVTLRQVYGAVLASARSSASIGILIGGAMVFNYVVTIENIPADLAALLADYQLSPAMFLVMVHVILLLLGCLPEGLTILLVLVPIFIPLAHAPGIATVHIGVVGAVHPLIGPIAP